jgi:hypothetical protein
VAGNKNRQVYVRFHVRVDEALDQAAELTGLKRASLVSWIICKHIRMLNQKVETGELSLTGIGSPLADGQDVPTLDERALGLSPMSTLFGLKIGRTPGYAPRSIGRPILLTLPPEVESELRLLAELGGMSVNHFRSAIVASFLIEQGVLK